MSPQPPERLGLVVERVRAQAAEFVAGDRDVRAGGRDAVRRQRVAVRRLRSCLLTFGRAFDRTTVDHISGELRWIGGLLGAVRDAELVETRLGDLGIPPGSTGVSLHLLEARATLTTAFGADRYRTLYDDLAAFAITPRFGSGDRGNRWLVGRVRREIDRTVDLARVAAELDGPARALGLHDVRRSARRVRYAAETLEPRYGGRARAVVKGFKSVQRTLGTHHDAIVLLAAFSDGSVTLPADPSGEVDRSPIARTQLLVAEAEARFWAVWPDIEAETHRRWPMG